MHLDGRALRPFEACAVHRYEPGHQRSGARTRPRSVHRTISWRVRWDRRGWLNPCRPIGHGLQRRGGHVWPAHSPLISRRRLSTPKVDVDSVHVPTGPSRPSLSGCDALHGRTRFDAPDRDRWSHPVDVAIPGPSRRSPAASDAAIAGAETAEGDTTTSSDRTETSAVPNTVPQRTFRCLSWLPRYRAKALRSDAIGALTAWAIVVPESVAYAQIAGVPPQNAFYAAPVALLAYATVSSSRTLVVGATSAAAILSA